MALFRYCVGQLIQVKQNHEQTFSSFMLYRRRIFLPACFNGCFSSVVWSLALQEFT